MLKGIEVPATGCSFGVSRLYAALQYLGKIADQDSVGPVIILVLDKERVADYQSMVREVRQAGIRAEMYVGTSGMRAQLKYADKRKSPVAVIEGEDELSKGQVTLKDLVLGSEKAAEIDDNVEWRTGKAAQLTISRDELVENVKSVLSRYSQAK